MNYVKILNKINKVPKRAIAGDIFDEFCELKGINLTKIYQLKNRILRRLLQTEGHNLYFEETNTYSWYGDRLVNGIIYHVSGSSWHVTSFYEEDTFLATHDILEWNRIKKPNKINDEWHEYYANALLNEVVFNNKFKQHLIIKRAKAIKQFGYGDTSYPIHKAKEAVNDNFAYCMQDTKAFERFILNGNWHFTGKLQRIIEKPTKENIINIIFNNK